LSSSEERSSFILKTFITLLIIFFTFIFYPFYTEGDQAYYRSYYLLVSGMHFGDVYKQAIQSLTSIEPIYPLLVYLTEPFFDHFVFSTFLNVLLALGLYQILRSGGVSKFSSLITCFSYYPAVMYLAADRLKVGFIAIEYALYYSVKGHTAKSVLFYIAAAISHLQMLIAIASLYTANWRQERGSLHYISLISAALGLVLMMIFFFPDHFRLLMDKLLYYINSRDLSNSVVKLTLMNIAVMFISVEWKKSLKLCLILSVAIIVFGPDRITMFYYFYFIYTSGAILPHQVFKLFLVFLVQIYFFSKELIFLSKVVSNNNGF
jgi:hypothetical protein